MLSLLLAAAVGVSAPSPSHGVAVRDQTPSILPGPPGRTRLYYIAADELIWDYTPTGSNQISGKPFEGIQLLWTARTIGSLGSKYRKALYREYTDASFSRLKPRAAEDEYLGFLGPVLRAEVGDTIRVLFKNNATHPYSMHPHGVFYDKSSEGAGYVDVTSTPNKAGVPPGGTHTYIWIASERAGPGPARSGTFHVYVWVAPVATSSSAVSLPLVPSA